MKNLLLLIIFIPSFAFAVNEGDFSIEMTGFGISHHFKDRESDVKDPNLLPSWHTIHEDPITKKKEWNETNFGLGASLVFHAERNFDVSVNIGSYNDSYDETAVFALVGFRKILGDRNGWNVSAGPYLGYYDGSGFDGVGLIVVGRISYDWIGLNITGSPNFTQDGEEHSGSICAFVSMRVLTF
jgi:hypothetical protein